MMLGTAGVAVAIAMSPLGARWSSDGAALPVRLSENNRIPHPRLPWVCAPAPAASLAWGEWCLPRCRLQWGRAAPSPVVPPPPVRIGEQTHTPLPTFGALPWGEGGGDSHGARGFTAGGSRRCTWRHFILASCLGCFSFLLRRAVAGLGDAGIPRPAGCVVAVPGAGDPTSLEQSSLL